MALTRKPPALDIDFAAPSIGHVWFRVRLISLIGCIAALGALGWAASDASTLIVQRQATDLRLAHVQKQFRARQQSRPHSSTVMVGALEMQEINATIARLNLPWDALFASIETSTPAGISLLELTPDAKKQTVTGVAEAAGSDDMLAYVERLAGQRIFSTVTLNRHETSQADPNKPLRFQFAARWEGGTR